MTPESWHAANKLMEQCGATIQKRSFSRLNCLTGVRLFKSHTRIVRSSETERIKSWRGWNTAQITLPVWPRQVSTSQALVSLMRHNLTKRSSAAETINGNVG